MHSITHMLYCTHLHLMELWAFWATTVHFDCNWQYLMSLTYMYSNWGKPYILISSRWTQLDLLKVSANIHEVRVKWGWGNSELTLPVVLNWKVRRTSARSLYKSASVMIANMLWCSQNVLVMFTSTWLVKNRIAASCLYSRLLLERLTAITELFLWLSCSMSSGTNSKTVACSGL